MYKHIGMLPRIDGYEFIGKTQEGEKKCRIVLDPEFSSFYVDGEAKYYELIAWRPIQEEKKD